jgi:hypothetical protein
MVTDWVVATVEVEAVKVAVDTPAATVTEAGTLTAPLLLETETTAELDAGPDSVTVQALEVPPGTAAGEH